MMRDPSLTIAVLFACSVAGGASAAVLWDQHYEEPSVGVAGLMFLGLSSLEEYNKADDFILDGSVGTVVEKVTIYAVDTTETEGVPNNNQPMRASVVFLENDALYPGGVGEDMNRPALGQCATPDARPTDWAPGGKTSEQIAAWFPWEATRGAGGYAGGGNTSWMYKAVVQTDGRGLTVSDTGFLISNKYKIWQLDIVLPTPQTLQADTRYWVSWATSAQANWLPGDPGNNGQMWTTPVQSGPTLAGAWEGNVNNRLWGGGYDFHFVLEGSPVPEPSVLALAAFGALVFFVCRRGWARWREAQAVGARHEDARARPRRGNGSFSCWSHDRDGKQDRSSTHPVC